MKNRMFLLKGVIFFLSILVCAGEARAQEGEAKELEALAQEYARLRARAKVAVPGVFDRELQGSGGRFGQVMLALGQHLGNARYRRKDIIEIMGEPDVVLEAGEYQPGSPGSEGGAIPEGAVHLVYFWRGWHDYLYFVCEGETVVRAAWYAALD